MTNKEKSIITYRILQQRRKAKERKNKDDFLAHTIGNIDRVYRRNYRGTKRRGQI